MKALSLILLIFLCLDASAHGEDKLGPNGGYIRMPGAFHTEVVQQGKNQIRVYLLDVNWMNPSVKSSNVKAKLAGKSRSEAKCTIQTNHYLCSFERESDLNSGQLIIEAKREAQTGNPVSYGLPLRLERSHHGTHAQ